MVQMMTEAGRIETNRANAISSNAVAGEMLFNKGWSEKISETSPGKFSVPSEFTDRLIYTVVPGECFCSCESAAKGQLCKHLHLMNQLGNSACSFVPNLDIAMESWAMHLRLNSEHCIQDRQLMEISIKSELFNGVVNSCTLLQNTCTCKAYSYYGKCACLKLARLLLDVDQNMSQNTNHEILTSRDQNIPHNTVPQEPAPQVEIDQNIHENTEPQEHDCQPETQKTNRKQLTRAKLNNILDLIDQMDDVKPEVANLVDQLHSVVKGESAFPKKSKDRRRKITPLHPERQLIKIRKRDVERPKKKEQSMKEQLMPQTQNDHSCYVSSQHKESSTTVFKVTKFKTKYLPTKRKSLRKQLSKHELTCDKQFLEIMVTSQALDYIISERNRVPLPKDNLQASFFDSVLTKVKVLCGGLLQHNDETVLSQLLTYWKSQ